MTDFLKDMTPNLPPWARGISANAPIAPGLARWVPRYFDPPKVGSKVNILARSYNGDEIHGTVLGYEVSHGYLMVWVKPDRRPDWHVRDNPGRWAGLFAGIELEPA